MCNPFATRLMSRPGGWQPTLAVRDSSVIGLALGQGMMLVAIGAGIGVALGFGAGLVLSRSPLAVPPANVATLLASVLLAVAVGLAACAVPVLRATRVNPMEALREE
jgi:putative ABC transport system permease protein